VPVNQESKYWWVPLSYFSSKAASYSPAGARESAVTTSAPHAAAAQATNDPHNHNLSISSPLSGARRKPPRAKTTSSSSPS
jgi:hypothetical protein